MQVRSPFKLEKQCQGSCCVDIGIGGFLSKCHKAVSLPSCFESILGMTVESVQVSQVYLEWIGHRGLLEWSSDPWSPSRVSI